MRIIVTRGRPARRAHPRRLLRHRSGFLDRTSSLPEAQGTRIDPDPNPDTGTGGEQRTADPEPTVR